MKSSQDEDKVAVVFSQINAKVPKAVQQSYYCRMKLNSQFSNFMATQFPAYFFLKIFQSLFFGRKCVSKLRSVKLADRVILRMLKFKQKCPKVSIKNEK